MLSSTEVGVFVREDAFLRYCLEFGLKSRSAIQMAEGPISSVVRAGVPPTEALFLSQM